MEASPSFVEVSSKPSPVHNVKVVVEDKVGELCVKDVPQMFFECLLQSYFTVIVTAV